jgi:HK97 gp10 family phage protein
VRVSGRLSGQREIDAALRRAEQAAARDPAIRALMAGGEIIRREAASRVDRRTGALAGSMAVGEDAEFAEASAKPRVFVGPREGMGRRGSWEELGTVKQAADPFLRPALDARGDEAMREVGQRLGKGIEDSAGA